MLTQAAAAAIRIVLFRAGPQDFPYAPPLVASVPVVAVGAYGVLFACLLPGPFAIVLSLLLVASLAIVTRALLNVRGLSARFQQTFHALLAGGVVLTIVSLPPVVALAPTLEKVAANPELMNNPQQIQGPAWATFLLNIITLWALAVFANVFRHALNAPLWAGPLLALFVGFSVLTLALLFLRVVALLLGGGGGGGG